MKDLTDKFQSVSERTLRNDLQTLISSSSIERFGAIQGPFSYYRFKNKALTESQNSGLNQIGNRTNAPSYGVTKDEMIAL